MTFRWPWKIYKEWHDTLYFLSVLSKNSIHYDWKDACHRRYWSFLCWGVLASISSMASYFYTLQKVTIEYSAFAPRVIPVWSTIRSFSFYKWPVFHFISPLTLNPYHIHTVRRQVNFTYSESNIQNKIENYLV
jgi:hypothetical protein